MAATHSLTLTLHLSDEQVRRLVADAARRDCTVWRWLQEQIEVALAASIRLPEATTDRAWARSLEPGMRESVWRGITLAEAGRWRLHQQKRLILDERIEKEEARDAEHAEAAVSR